MIQTTSELGPAAAAIATHCRLLHAVTKYKTTSPSPSGRLRWTSAVLPLIPRSRCACQPLIYRKAAACCHRCRRAREICPQEAHEPSRYLFPENLYENRNPSVRGRLMVFALT